MAGPPGGYAVLWRELDEPLATGKLVLEADGLQLEGAVDGRLARRQLPYERLDGVRFGRELEERINGRPTIVFERREAPSILVGPIGPGLLSEVADAVAELSSAWTDRLEQVAVVVPLRKRALERVRELVAQGPPVDLVEAGLERHYVFLSEREAVFVFDGPDVCETVRLLLREPALWRLSADWAACVAGRPRLAEAGFAWLRSSRGRR